MVRALAFYNPLLQPYKLGLAHLPLKTLDNSLISVSPQIQGLRGTPEIGQAIHIAYYLR